jgi:hypothetical protein
MSQRLFIAWFAQEDDVLAATTAAREAGLAIFDVFTPYAVHGMDAAMGLRPSRLTWVCFGAALLGLSAGISLQYYTSAVSWPLNVGGKPFNSFPAFVPVAFEMTVLFAALITVAALFFRTRLYPRLQGPPEVLARVTNDRFALALTTADPRWSETAARDLSRRHGAVDVGYSEVGS